LVSDFLRINLLHLGLHQINN